MYSCQRRRWQVRDVTLADWRCVLCLVTVTTSLYKSGVTLPTAPVAASLSQRVDYVSQFKSSRYIYSYRSDVMNIHIFYKLQQLAFDASSKRGFLYGNRSKPLIWLCFNSFSMCQMLLTETSLVKMCWDVVNLVQLRI